MSPKIDQSMPSHLGALPPRTDGVQVKTLADREKRRAALSSVVAAVFLTGFKIIVGVLTGSLGILAEAAHSALDLVAAIMTLVAVRVSGRPADRIHTYGHGKIENLSAMFETGLLLITCLWIFYEALRRLFFKSVHVEASVWAFLVMATSIVIDASRSRVLSRAAKKYHSQALEADALHFSTDIWSSSVVIAGLILVLFSKALRVPWLVKADALAALGVSAIVLSVSWRLGQKTLMALLDGVPASLREKVAEAASVPGVLAVEQARLRRSGPEIFVDLVLTVNRDATFEYTHDIATKAEAAVRDSLQAPGADVVVHVEPGAREGDASIATIRSIAAQHNLAAHSIYFYSAQGLRSLELHLEIDSRLQVSEAHARATEFEESLRKALPELKRIVTHLEPLDRAGSAQALTSAEKSNIQEKVGQVSEKMGVQCDPHEIQMEKVGGRVSLSFHCTLDAATNLAEAHRFTEEFERNLRVRLPNLGRVMIHIEPAEGGSWKD